MKKKKLWKKGKYMKRNKYECNIFYIPSETNQNKITKC